MEFEYKFMIQISDGEKEYHGEKYQIIINKIGCFNLLEAKKLKKAMIIKYPDKKILVKEKFRDEWKEINI